MAEKFDFSRNRKERIKFISMWAEYVKTHSDVEWSSQQKVLIDSQIKNAGQNSSKYAPK
jgi:hypothetical protein